MEEFDNPDYIKHEDDVIEEIIDAVVTKGDKARYSRGWTESMLQRAAVEKYRKKCPYILSNKYFYNFKDCKNFESDCILFHKSGKTTELEIKLTASDHHRERFKKVDKHNFLQLVYDTEGECLLNPRYNPDRKNSKEFKYTCPSEFVFFCQEGLISPEYVKENYPYAGLKWIDDKGRIKTKVRTRLHNYKIPYQETLLKKCYFGQQNLESRLWEVKRNYHNLSDIDLKSATFMRSFLEKSLKKLKV